MGYEDYDDEDDIEREESGNYSLVRYEPRSGQSGLLSERLLLALICLTIGMILCAFVGWRLWDTISKIIGSITGVFTGLLSGVGHVAPLVGFVLGLSLCAVPIILVLWLGAHLYLHLKGSSIRNRTFAVNPDVNNYDALYDEETGTFIQPEAGELPQYVPQVPQTYSPHITYRGGEQYSYNDYEDEAEQDARLLEPGQKPLHIPSFAEALEDGAIGPGQQDLLFCYELILDEETGQLSIAPLRGKAEAGHTQFIAGGSESGKSTYVAQIVAQETAMKTLHYLIDPHLAHQEKSIAAKLRAFSDWLLLPPAQSHDEIRRVLEHAKRLKEAFLTRTVPMQYQGYRIKFIVDEVAALMYYQNANDPKIRQLYTELAMFMGGLGIEMAKFGFTGLYMSQFTTKKQLGKIEFRDACMSQMLLKLPAAQAHAFRVLTSEQVQELTHFEKGNGFLILSNNPYPRRVAFGDAQPQDLDRFAALLPPSPLKRRPTSPGYIARPSGLEVPTPIEMPAARNEVPHEVPTEAPTEAEQEVAFEVPAEVLRIEPEMTFEQYQLFIEMVINQDSTNDILKKVFGIERAEGGAYQSALRKYRAILSYILKSLKRPMRQEA